MKLLPLVILAVIATISTALVPPAIVAPSGINSSFGTGWLVEAVAYHGGSAPPALDVDAHARPHVLYCPPGEAWYAARRNGNWTRELLTETPYGGVCGELAIGPAGEPHVMTPIALGVGKPLYGVRGGGNWTFEATDIGSVEAVDSSGRPHSAYLVRTAPDRVALEHVWRDGVWRSEDVEAFNATTTILFRWVSFRLDAADQPHVLYYEDVRDDVRYAFRDSEGWHVEVVEHIGAIPASGRQGSLALDPQGNPYVIYYVYLGSIDAVLRYAVRSSSGWTISDVEPGLYPNISVGRDGVPRLVYVWGRPINLANYSFDADLVYRELRPTGWTREVVLDGYQYGNDPRNQRDDIVYVPQFVSAAVDQCGNPHIAFYLNWGSAGNLSKSGAYYATRGQPCPSVHAILRVEPRTLNLKSNGQWVNTQITVENATTSDIDIASLALNGVPAARVDIRNNTTLNVKFDRAAFAATLQPGDAVVVTLSGRWRGGGTFTATDAIRIVDSGGGHKKP